MASDSERLIRAALVRTIRAEFAWGVTLHELQLRSNRAFVDVAHIDDKLRAFEIKSERDALARLSRQEQYYSEACHECTLVVHESHRDAEATVPPWWGIRVARGAPGGITIATARAARHNPRFDSCQLARSLRSAELERLIQSNDPSARISMLTKEELVRRAFGVLGSDLLAKLSLEILRTRKTWTIRQLGVTTEEERLAVARGLPRPQLGALALVLPLGASA